MAEYNFDEVIDRRGSSCLKWDYPELLMEWGLTERFDEDTLPLFVADMDIPVPPAIERALQRTAGQRIFGYTQPSDEYYRAVSGWFSRRHGWSIPVSHILYCPGTVRAVEAGIQAFSSPGEGVIIQRPVYYPFTSVIHDSGREVVNNQLEVDEEGRYTVNMADFEEKARRKENTVFILCNPHNPTGRIIRPEELREMARICRENNVVILADEIHGDLIRCNEEFVPMAKCAGHVDNLVTLTAVNKTFNVAGLHASNAVISSSELRGRFKKALGSAMISPFTASAVIAGYNECEDWLEALKKYLDGTFDWVLDFLRREMPAVKCVRPEGTYILWMDFRGYGLSPEEVHRKIYVDANVVLESGTLFDPDRGSGFERVCLSSPRPVIQKAFKRMAAQFRNI